jgi:hypothetical protein
MAVQAVQKIRPAPQSCNVPGSYNSRQRANAQPPSILSPDWVLAMEYIYKKSADTKNHPMRKAMLVFCLQTAGDLKAAKASADFKGLIDREPRFARDWATGIIESSHVYFQ